MRASRAFKDTTGVGTDSLHPRSYGHGSRRAAEGIAALLMRVEAELAWPQSIAVIHYVMVPKPSGDGERPVGILLSLVRIWERIRLPRVPRVRRWMEEQRRSYDWARSGASAEQAVWLQLLETEVIGFPEGPDGGGPSHDPP